MNHELGCNFPFYFEHIERCRQAKEVLRSNDEVKFASMELLLTEKLHNLKQWFEKVFSWKYFIVMSRQWTAGLFDSALIVIRIVAVMFVSIYAIVICRKRRTNDFVSTTTMSADAVSPIPCVSCAFFLIRHPMSRANVILLYYSLHEPVILVSTIGVEVEQYLHIFVDLTCPRNSLIRFSRYDRCKHTNTRVAGMLRAHVMRSNVNLPSKMNIRRRSVMNVNDKSVKVVSARKVAQNIQHFRKYVYCRCQCSLKMVDDIK